MGVCYLYGAYVAYTIGSHMFSHPLLVQLVKVSFRAGSHLNRTGTGSAFLCDSYATLCSVIFFSLFIWMVRNRTKSSAFTTFPKMHGIRSHGIAVPWDPIQANTLQLRSAFGVSYGFILTTTADRTSSAFWMWCWKHARNAGSPHSFSVNKPLKTYFIIN